MQLYTSLVRLKQAMNGGQMPPMTPVPESVHHIIDPALTIGLGALMEDEEKGLRCPVRSCGEWFHNLGQHIRKTHTAVGCDGVRRALEIPSTAALLSTRHIEARKTQSATAANRARLTDPELRRRALQARSVRAVAARRARSYSRNSRSTGRRNLANSCRAQLSHALIDLHHRLGRSPSVREAKIELGSEFVSRVETVFGTWTSAVAQCGLEAVKVGRPAVKTHAVLTALGSYFDAHQQLPRRTQADAPTRAPLIPSSLTIKRALGEPTWEDCMRKAARLLGIRDGRYGLQPFPEERESAA